MLKIKIILGISLVILLIIWGWERPDGKVRVVFCNVGQGDGIIISQNNFQMVIDAGPNNRKILGCLERQMPFWDKEIEIVVITHWDTDHSGGLSDLMQNYKIDSLYGSSWPKETNVQKIYTDNLRKNDSIKYDKISFEVLNPERDWKNENDNSIAGKLTYKDKFFLMMADVSTEVEQKLVWRKEIQPVEVLKVSHHGSAEATSQELLDITKPKEAIISVGKNYFGHPNKEVVERLEKNKINIRRTDVEGDIIYTW